MNFSSSGQRRGRALVRRDGQVAEPAVALPLPPQVADSVQRVRIVTPRVVQGKVEKELGYTLEPEIGFVGEF
jgi:hypothetical protein